MGEREGVGTLRGKSSTTAIATPSCPLVVPIPSQSGCEMNNHIKQIFRVHFGFCHRLGLLFVPLNA